MSTLFNILEEVRYGEDFVSTKMKYGEINEHYNTDYGYFDYVKRIKSLSEALTLSSTSSAILEKIVEDIQDTVTKFLEEGRVSSSYRKMKADSVFLNIKKLKENVENVTLLESRKYKSENLGKLFSTVYSAYSDILKSTEYSVKALPESKFEKVQKAINEDLKSLSNYLED